MSGASHLATGDTRPTAAKILACKKHTVVLPCCCSIRVKVLLLKTRHDMASCHIRSYWVRLSSMSSCYMKMHHYDLSLSGVWNRFSGGSWSIERYFPFPLILLWYIRRLRGSDLGSQAAELTPHFLVRLRGRSALFRNSLVPMKNKLCKQVRLAE